MLATTVRKGRILISALWTVPRSGWPYIKTIGNRDEVRISTKWLSLIVGITWDLVLVKNSTNAEWLRTVILGDGLECLVLQAKTSIKRRLNLVDLLT